MKRKILVVRFSSIGDIVLTTPVLRCLQEQLNCDLHFLTKPAYADMVEANPHVDKVHVLKPSLMSTLVDLHKEKYDFVVDLHNNLRSHRVTRALHVKHAKFPKLNFLKWLLVRFKINRMPDVHIVDRYFKAVELLGVQNDERGLDFFITNENHVSIESLPEGFDKGFLVVVMGSKHQTKQIPQTKLIEICRQSKRPMVLLGDKNDFAKAEMIEQAIGSGRVFNGCGKFNIQQSADIVRQADVVLTGDTGLMHIAAAFKKNIVSVWGNTVPEFGMYPYLPHEIRNSYKVFEVCDLDCRPCSKLGFEKCPKKHFNCMMMQDYESIIRAINI